MAENKKSVLLYCDIIHTVEELSDTQAGKLFKHYLRYINDMNPDAPDKLTKVLFEPIKQNLKRDLKKWEAILTKRSEAGLASAEKRKQIQHMSTHVESVQHTSTNPTVTATVNVNVNVINKQQVVEFLRSAGLPSDRVEYETNELMKVYNGKGIKNLKALCNTWAENVRTQQIMPSPEKNMNHFI